MVFIHRDVVIEQDQLVNSARVTSRVCGVVVDPVFS